MTVQRSDFGHFLQIATRWSDLDALGHVNNSRFFTFDESVRLDYFGGIEGATPQEWSENGAGLILARIECDFIAQLHHPAQVNAGFRIARMGRSSMNTIGGMFAGDKLVAVTRGVLVWFDYRAQKSLPIPDGMRARIRQRERLAPDES